MRRAALGRMCSLSEIGFDFRRRAFPRPAFAPADKLACRAERASTARNSIRRSRPRDIRNRRTNAPVARPQTIRLFADRQTAELAGRTASGSPSTSRSISSISRSAPASAWTDPIGRAQQTSRNFAWRDYGNRVGNWRLFEILDELKLPATVLLNSSVCHHYPDIVEKIKQRGDDVLGHGRTNAEVLRPIWEHDEARVIQESHRGDRDSMSA